MPILVGVTLFIQLCFAAHALKTGRPYWWIMIIMAFPVMGCALYYFLEVFPGSREHYSAHKTARKLIKALQPDADLKRRVEELETCGSADNKIALAQECMNHQMYEEAIKLLESCLNGPFENDGNILFTLAKASVENENWSKAAETIVRLKTHAAAMRPQEVSLLEARLLAGRGETDAALVAYRNLIPGFVGLEALYRYGALLAELGQHEAASEMFNEVIKHGKRFPAITDDEKQWITAAKRAIGI